MRYAGALTFIRDKVRIKDVYTCMEASRLFLEAQELNRKGFKKFLRWFLMLHYLKRMVSALTGKKARFWQLFGVHRLMDAAGFKRNDQDVDSAEDSLGRSCYWIGARLGQTHESICSDLSVDQIQPTIFEIMKYDLEKSRNMIMAHHAPEHFLNIIQEEFNKLNYELRHTSRQITDKVEKVRAQIDRYGRPQNNLAAGLRQPC